jgi:hypothetical protein
MANLEIQQFGCPFPSKKETCHFHGRFFRLRSEVFRGDLQGRGVHREGKLKISIRYPHFGDSAEIGKIFLPLGFLIGHLLASWLTFQHGILGFEFNGRSLLRRSDSVSRNS